MRKILDGKKLSQDLLEAMRKDVQQEGLHPVLTVIQVGFDPASDAYIRSKRRACETVGIELRHIHLLDTISQDYFDFWILNAQRDTDGLIIQLPVPGHLDVKHAQRIIDPRLDVDGFLPGSPYTPCTALGVMMLLEAYAVPLEGKHAVVVGRSETVGKPIAAELLKRNCTVTVCHSRTDHMQSYVRSADLLVTAVGKPGFIRHQFVRPDTVIVDVGITRVDGKLCGDVDPEVMWQDGSLMTPVPGGVGPMTVAALMHNTIEAARHRRLE